MSKSKKTESWIERAKKGEGANLFKEIFGVICDNVMVCQEDRVRIKVFFENAQPENLAQFFVWLNANEFVEYFIVEVQLNLPWEIAATVIQGLDPEGEHKLADHVR
ncbi:MAG: hypothetical protein UY41_C0018G0020 [Candidatus Moranbacteria bacterium GW2011_GWE1_49_15]|nr:MAG: hypothetical protein UX75_C0040G0004 [Candidatus Moranbacteria bacterium GW2011_GWE2_47_10]KKW06662.1 MAG: hypothetical protein UY41_C0018G0020 [Candidatus Moranbacteria bacterium GW2011_GWE1_49_15]HBP00715.1 hypothetical protein [Candidatus Moranbacteria bacterium]